MGSILIVVGPPFLDADAGVGLACSDPAGTLLDAEAHGEDVGISPLTASTAGVDDEILDLEEPVQPEIPVGNLLWVRRRQTGRGWPPTVPDYRGARLSASSAPSAGLSKGNENNGGAGSTARTVVRTVAGSADGQADDGNAARGSTVRVNPLKNNGADDADDADANFLSQSGSEKGVDDMELPAGADARTIRGVI